MESDPIQSHGARLNHNNFSEVTWDTVVGYLNQEYEIPIPMCASNACILIIRPGVNIELQLRSSEAYLTRLQDLPNLVRLKYDNLATKSYEYLAIICHHSEFDETVLKFFNSIALNFIVKKLSAGLAIKDAYKRWKQLLTQVRTPDDSVLIGLWGELFIIHLVMSRTQVDPMPLIKNWTGPHGGANDFSFGNTCIEIKTTTRQSNIIEISSIDQLDANHAWVVLVRALYMPVSDGGITISNLANLIRSRLDINSVDIFDNAITGVTYISDLSQLDSFSLRVDDIPIAISIDASYPVLTRSRLSSLMHTTNLDMLLNVKYTLNINDPLKNGITDIPNLFRNIMSESLKYE